MLNVSSSAGRSPVERVLNLVRDAGSELAERRHLFGMNQGLLRAAQSGERSLRLLLRFSQCLLSPANGGNEELQGTGHVADFVAAGGVDRRLPAAGMRQHTVAKRDDPAQDAAAYIEECE